MKSSLAVLCGLHLLGNALVLWLGYLWLSMPESDAFHLLGSVLVILLLVSTAVWLHGTAFAFFSRIPQFSLPQSAKVALRHLPVLLVLVLVTLLLYYGLHRITNALDEPAFQLASWLTLMTRKPVPPPAVLSLFRGIVWLLQWLALPALLVPAAAAMAAGNFRQWRLRAAKSLLWQSLIIFGLLLGAVWLPVRLLSWVPKMPNFSAEMASFLLRGAVSYLLFVGFMLLLERIAASGTPSLTQRNSSAVP